MATYFCCGTSNKEKELPIGWTCEDIEVSPCEIYAEGFTGVSTPDVQPFTKFSLNKPPCCEITLTLDSSVIVLPEDLQSYEFETECEISSVLIEGDCIDEVSIFVSNIIPAVIETVCTFDPNSVPNNSDEFSRFPCKYCP